MPTGSPAVRLKAAKMLRNFRASWRLTWGMTPQEKWGGRNTGPLQTLPRGVLKVMPGKAWSQLPSVITEALPHPMGQ